MTAFVLLALPLLAVCLGFYAVLIQRYESAVARVANLALARLSRPFLLEVDPDGTLALYAITSDGARKLTTPRAHGIYLSLALLPALVLATPVPLRDRLRWLLFSMPLLFASHVLAVLAMYWAYLVLRDEPRNLPYEVLYGLSVRSGQLIAVALWALFTWRFWIRPLAGRERLPASTRTRR